MSAANPMWTYLLEHELAGRGVERRVEARELLQRLHAGAHDEREQRELDAARRRLVLQPRAGRLDVGDVGFVELRDVRNVHPAGMQARPGDLLDAAQRLALDRAELREIDLRQRGNAAAGAAAGRGEQRA